MKFLVGITEGGRRVAIDMSRIYKMEQMWTGHKYSDTTIVYYSIKGENETIRVKGDLLDVIEVMRK